MKQQTSISQKLQKFGAFLAGMVIPNIGAFIGFGLITAFFLETGWTPEERLATLITPILNNLLPVLIAHTGGKMVGGDRGGVLGAFVTIGAIIAVEGTPMFMAAMILGPFSGWVIRKFDHAIDGKIPGGFEMIVNNFSLGIIGAILCCFAYLIFGPIMNGVTTILTNGVNWIIAHNVLPLTAIFVEPAKVLFLNNALDHGIFGPIGYEQVKTIGHSALFLLVPNPGPGLGLLLAYWIFGKGEMKDAAPGMILIHFFGGIHEVYFPYVLSNPITLIGMIAAGIASTGTLTLLNVGMVATPSPGSIFSVIALSPPDGMVGVLLAVAISCIVSFLLNAIFVKMQYRKNEEITMGEPVIQIEAMGQASDTAGLSATSGARTVDELDLSNINLIVVACDAGMGSSAMGAIVLQKKLEVVGLSNITVYHCSMYDIPVGSKDIVCPKEMAVQVADNHHTARIIPIDNFLDAPEYELIVEELMKARVNMNKNGDGEDYHGGVLLKKNIRLDLPSKKKEAVIRDIGNALVECGYVTPKYVDGMVAKEDVFNTCLGNLLALPHGIESVIGEIKNSGLAIFSYPDGVDWGEGQIVKLVIAVASAGDEHIETLGKIAGNCGTEEEVEEIMKMSVDEIYDLFV